jgi:hypothetical protein
LAEDAMREDDKFRRRYLIDLAGSSLAAADAIAPELPPEPRIFRNTQPPYPKPNR